MSLVLDGWHMNEFTTYLPSNFMIRLNYRCTKQMAVDELKG